MADIRIAKHAVETVSDSPAYAGNTRTSVEIAGANSSNSSPKKLAKFAAEVIANSPLHGGQTRLSVEVAGANSSNQAPLKLAKFAAEVLSSKLKVLDVTRQALEVIGSKSDTSVPVNIAKLGVEFVARASPSLPEILPEPDYWKVFCHNWADSVKLSTAYLTDVTRSPYDLTEERRGLLNRPFRTLTYKWRALKRESLNAMLSYLRRMTIHRVFMPLYNDQIHISETLSVSPLNEKTVPCVPGFKRVFVNQRIALIKLDEDLVPSFIQLHTVAAKGADHIETSDWLDAGTYEKSRTVILPCIDTELVMEPKIEFLTDLVADMELTIYEVTGKTALPPIWTGLPTTQTFGGYPIFTFEPNWSLGRPRIHLKREGEIVDQGKGRFPITEGSRYRVLHNMPLSFEREDFFEYLKFFDSRRGRLRPFWFIDLDYSWQFAGQGGIGNIYLDIQPINDFEDFSYNPNDDFNHVGILLNDGTAYIREVTAFDDTGSVYRLTVSGLPTLAASTIRRISRARLSRFLRDALDEEWFTSEWVRISGEVIELLNDTEVTLE